MRAFVRQQDAEWEWALFDHSGLLSEHGIGDLGQLDDQLRAADDDYDLIWVLSGDDVLFTEASVPSKQYRQIVQAVPYVVEEQLAVDVEQCFFALGDRTNTGEITVAIVDRVLLETTRERAMERPARLSRMLSEPNLLATSESTEVLIDGDRAHLRSPSHQALTVSFDALPLALSLLPQASLQITLPAAATDRVNLLVSEFEAAGGNVALNLIEEAPFVFLACGLKDQINFLQGDLKVEARKSSRPRVWRSAAMLVGFGLLLHLGLTFGQGWYLADLAQQYRADTMALYKAVFPADKNVRDVRRRWNNHLGKSDGGTGAFIPAFAQSARGLSAAGLTLSNVNYNESRGDLILQVTGARSESLVEYAQRLSSSGLNAEIGTINQEGDTVRGSIKIKVSG